MNRQLLTVDIGNSAIKVGCFEWSGLSDAARGGLPEPLEVIEWPTSDECLPLDARKLAAWLGETSAQWVVSSVNRAGWERVSSWVNEHRAADELRLLTYRDLPLTVAVEYPERVGMDRLLTALGADYLCERQRAAIVIDAGTALKVHAVTADGVFVGGAILPGLRLAAETLAGRTDLLPLIQISTAGRAPIALGQNTEQAIQSGIYWGAIGAIKELISRIQSELVAHRTDPNRNSSNLPNTSPSGSCEPARIYVTGGDARGLMPLLDAPADFIPHLCLRAIARLSV